MIRYAITSGDYRGRPAALVEVAKRWAEVGVEFVQVREKDMQSGELIDAVRGMAEVFRAAGHTTKLLVNGRVDVAAAAKTAGVHLTGRPEELTAEQVRRVFDLAGLGVPVISASCHTVAEVVRASRAGVDLILFGPVFEKRVDKLLISEGKGVEMLRKACRAAGEVPVLALGGITEENAGICMEAGTAGVAGIKMFVPKA